MMRDMIRVFTISILLSFIPLCLSAQADAPYERPCATEEHHAFLMKTDADYKARFLQTQAALKEARAKAVHHPAGQRAIYTIPVVVHIVHLGESIGSGSNMSDAEIHEAIRGLNDRYANFNGNGIDIEINFCLANRDPNGCPTSGINRVDGSGVANYISEGVAFSDGCGASEIEIKDLIKWPTWQYYNIWVVHDICGDIAGYAYYPNGNEYDGTIIDVPSMTYSSRTLAHELGHGLNLQHTFSGDEDGEVCPEDADCADDGDEICDTPPHRRNDCGLNNPCGSGTGEWEDSRFNWMSYCSTSAEQGRFTEDQRDRMHVTMQEWPRNLLLESDACDNAVSMLITSDNEQMCSGETRILTAQPEGGSFVVADGPGVINGNVLTSTGGGIIVVEYVYSEEGCTSSVFQAISSKLAPTSRLLSDADSICIGQSTSLRGIPSGGEFFVLNGPGTIDSTELIATGEGVIELLYSVYRLGCLSTDTAVVISMEQPEVEIEFLSGDFLVAVPETGTYQWLSCDPVMEAIPGATESTFTATTSGSYAVVMQQGDCVDTSTCVVVEVTALQDGNLEDIIKLYPNPVSDVLYFEYEGVQAPINIVLNDMNGLRITSLRFPSQSKTGLNFAGFAPGVYFLDIEVEGVGRYYYRFVKV
jgi:hypothetical protein